MKASCTPIRVISGLTLLLLVILIVNPGCKKKDDPEPPQPNPLPTLPENPDVFTNKPLHIMSDYEVKHSQDFVAHKIRLLGHGLAGDETEPDNPYAEAAKMLWEIQDYENTKMEFANINNGLSKLSGQVAQLQQSITDLGQQLSLDVSELEEIITSIAMNTYFTQIKGLMDSTTHDGLLYYSSEAAKYKAGKITKDVMNTDTALLRDFCHSIYYAQPGATVHDWSEQLNALICPSSGGANALITYANVIIKTATSKGYTDSASMMNLFMLMESYFMQVVNKQFQCVNLWSNACNYFFPTSGQANAYYTGTFRANIIQEVAAYLSVVEYLMANLSEYRNQQRFQYDMNFANNGLAPDNVFLHVMARAQFIANLVYDALGLPYPVMCGHILIPCNYGEGNPTHGPNISVTVYRGSTPETIQHKDTTITSQLPYTYWNVADQSTCYHDNNWASYRFGKLGLAHLDWPTSPCAIKVIDNGNANTPWVHYADIKGNVTPMYYNPQNPSQKSTTKNSTCTIPFAFFSANWQWGFLRLTNSTAYWRKIGNNFDIHHFYNILYTPSTTPFCGTTDGGGMFYQHCGAAAFSYPNMTPGIMQMTGPLVKTDHYYMCADDYYCNVTTTDVPEVNGSMVVWGSFQVNHTFQTQHGDDIWVFMGVGLSCNDPYGNYTVGWDVVNSTYHNLRNWASGFGASGNLQTNHGYQPGVQYYFQTYNVGNINGGIALNTQMQVVYGGYYQLTTE
jgi:hypothetical protein